jgi:hypothetical protein
VSPFRPAHVNASTFRSSRCLPPERTCANALSSACEERCRRWPAGTVTARVHRRSKTSTRPLSARYSRTSSRPRAPLRLLQVNVSTSTTRDLSNIPYHGGGRDDCHGGPRESPLWIRQPPKVHRVRGREHRASTLPTVIAHGEDFAPTPIASGTSCRGYRPLPGPE